jgi:hypothetical protein
VPDGESITIPDKGAMTNPSRVFGGWNTKSDGTGTAYTVGDTLVVNGNTQLFARWIKEVYEVGDKGPAGGLVFYDKGNNSGGWRYLEAAPALTEVKAKWQISFYDTGAKGVEVGTGKQNTQKIIDASNQIAVNAPATRHCDRLVYGGYDDWYLPSKNELGLMYMNLKVDGLGVFSGNIYWSSSQGVDRFAAWRQNFSDGTQTSNYPYSNDQEYLVRAIRQF